MAASGEHDNILVIIWVLAILAKLYFVDGRIAASVAITPVHNF
jgi:hypothetical protein